MKQNFSPKRTPKTDSKSEWIGGICAIIAAIIGVFNYNLNKSNEILETENAALTVQVTNLQNEYSNLQEQYNSIYVSNENNANQTITQKVDVNISADIEERFETKISELQDELLNEFELLKEFVDNQNTEIDNQNKDTILKHGIYHGDIENGKYNDDSGNAFKILLDDDGFVNMLYVGKFKDGYFEDNSKNAWLIMKMDKYYGYYKGEYTEGHSIWDEESCFICPISINEIEDIVNEVNINYNLKWYDFDI